MSVIDELADVAPCHLSSIVNLSTVGIDACHALSAAVATLDNDTVDYIDAPISGGRMGAVNGTLTVMWSGSKHKFEQLKAVLESFSGSLFFVGEKPGQGQALKLLNNFLSGVAMTATSEAVRFGLHHGLDLETLLNVVHVSTGQNTAVSDKFPKRVLTETYDAGFRMRLMEKDISLYLQAVTSHGLNSRIAEVAAGYWQQGVDQYPDGDFTEIFKVIDT
jgi:3-hydroxyisobutyrate dehydrogenase-like beta-hydroxyacid dehydrogenase